MASFEKKLSHFLDTAVQHQLLEPSAAESLNAFAQDGEYEHKGWLSLSGALGGLGALALCFGIVLMIASNWYMFSDFTKISAFIVLLGGTHFAGLYLAGKQYPKTAAGLHVIGAGLCIAGVGLIAQIFHLHSRTGESFLLWAAMIAPLAVLLRNGPIALLSVVAFSIWGTVYMGSLISYKGWTAMCAFHASVCLAAALGGLLLKHRGSALAPFLQIPGMIGVIGWVYFFGFAHHFGYRAFSDDHIAYLLIPFLALVPAVISGLYLWVRHMKTPGERYFLMAMGSAALTVLLVLFAMTVGVDKQAYIEHFSFGWVRKVYILPFFISISAWVAYFGLAFWGVIYGALRQQRWMLNANIILIGVGVFTRFIDLMGTMMNTGIMFIVCGLLLCVLGFVLEKWRRRLIAQSRTSGTGT